jgi:hypothetical protein
MGSTAPRIAALVVGLALLALFLQSVSRAALVNRHRGDRLARGIGRLVCSALTRLASLRRDYESIQDVLAWVLPLYTLLLILSWFTLVLAGFSLIIWSWHVEPTVLEAATASGSALSTLGFQTPTGILGQWLAIIEGAVGLGVVVFFFTFIPGYQTSIQEREQQVAWVYARAGVDPSGFALIEWLRGSGATLSASGVWEDWELWFRQLIESLTLAPVLAFVPTLQRGQSWLTAASTLLDATSFSLAALECKGMAAARLCYDTGVYALRLLAAQTGRPISPEQTGASCTSARASFDAAYERMADLGVPIRTDRNEAWQRYVTLRRQYETPLLQLATCLLIPTENGSLLPQRPVVDFKS